MYQYTRISSSLYFGFEKQKGFFIATPEKAFLDAMYLASFGRYALDLASIDAGKLDRNKLKQMSKKFPLKTQTVSEKKWIPLKQHEIFEIEVLDRMKSAKLLDPLVFGGGTMLRLCHELPRYSVDLDFWFIKKTAHEEYLDRLQQAFEKDFEITDAQMKHYTLLLEVRSPQYPRRLKIEVRREMKDCDFQDKIAFSRYATKQVMLRAHTLEQTMKNKIAAFLDRGEIRDCFDIEFMLRRGISLPDTGCAAGYRVSEKTCRA